MAKQRRRATAATDEAPSAKRSSSEKPKSETCQVRFPGAQMVLVKGHAKAMGLPVGTFIRLATLSAAGLAQDEITRLRKIANSLENIAEAQTA